MASERNDADRLASAQVDSAAEAPSPSKLKSDRAQDDATSNEDALGLFQEDYSPLTLLDLAVVIEAHVDLWRRKLNFDEFISDTKAKARGIQLRAEEASKRLLSKAENLTSPPSGPKGGPSASGTDSPFKRAAAASGVSFKDVPGLAAVSEQWESAKLKPDAWEREVHKFRRRISTRAAKIQARWDDARLVSFRDKVAFLFGVFNVVSACLMLGFRPHWIPWVYTVQALTLLPYRAYTYKQKNYHYFLLDSCYAINLMALLFIWLAPSSRLLYEATFALTHGPLLAAVAAWHNSLVFHSLDKVTSLFIHVYPALCMTTITHHLPDALERYPALRDLKTNQLNVTETFVAAAISYFIWQGLYWRFVLIARRQKIEQGGRITSFTYMLNAKHGAIGRALSGVKPQYRESAFMAGQSVFTLVTMAPVPWIFSSSWFAGFYLLLIFGFATWNGAAFYIDVYLQKETKKLQQELDQLRDEAAAMRSSSSGSLHAQDSSSFSSADSQPDGEEDTGALAQKADAPTNQVPEISLGASRTSEGGDSQSSGELVDAKEAHGDQDSGHLKSE